MLFRILCAAAAVWVTPSAVAQAKPTYFIVDASGSMKGKNQDEAKALLQALSLPRDQLISVTYFGAKPTAPDIDLCREELDPPEPQQRGADFQPNFPVLGGEDSQTAIGNALTSVIDARQGEGRFILITDGIEECAADFVAVRKRYPKTEILVRQVGDTPNAALQLLELEPNSQQPAPAAAPLVPVPLPVLLEAPEPKQPTLLARLAWVLLVAISALAGMQFCLQSGRRTETLREHLSLVDKKTSEQLEAIYSPTTKTTGGKEVRKKDSDRYDIHWFKNRRGQVWGSNGLLALILAIFAAMGWALLAFPAVPSASSEDDFVQIVRSDSWNFLNSNIGAYSFAGTIIALAGFSAFQWWQTLEAKKELMIRSGIITNERAEVLRARYERVRRNIRRIKFTLPTNKFSWFFGSEQIEISGFDALQAMLLEIAAPRFEDASTKRLQSVQVFENVRDPFAFATLLHLEKDLTDDQLDGVSQLLEHARHNRLTEAEQVTRRLVEELGSKRQLAASQ